MTERDIRDLAKQAGFKGRIRFYSSKKHRYSNYGAVAHSKSRTICFNRKHTCGHRDTLYVKALFLHEWGHVAAAHSKVAPIREAQAHNWAIVKAMQLHWTDIAQYLVKGIEGWKNDKDPLYVKGHHKWSKLMEN